MTEVTRCVFLQSIKQSATSLVLRVYSNQYGVCSYLYKGSQGKGRNVPLVPLAVYELVAPPFDGKLKVIKTISLDVQLPIPHVGPLSAGQALFISEAMVKCLSEEPPSSSFFDYLCQLAVLLGSNASVPDLHVSFLVQTAALTGILPDAESGNFFDLREGQFCTTMPMHGDVIDGDDTRIFRQCLSLGAFGAQAQLPNRLVRMQATRLWLRYLKTHLAGMGHIKSLDVLEEIFGD